MRPIEIALGAATVLSCTLVGYRIGRKANRPSGEIPDQVATAVEDSVKTPGAAGKGGLERQPMPFSPARSPLALPKLGTLDQRLLNGELRLGGVRIKAVTTFHQVVTENCRHLHHNGDSEVEALLQLAIKEGIFTIASVSNVTVSRGAPLDERAASCISQLFARPMAIAGPNQIAPAFPGLTAKPTRRWYGMDGTAGTVVATARFMDRPECALPSPRTVRPARSD